MKLDLNFYLTLLNSLKNPIVFVDTDHVIKYMNHAATLHYEPGEKLIDTSIFDCHNAQSNEEIRRVFKLLQGGDEEHLITDNEKHRIYMRAVRDATGQLVGYYERYEPPR